MGELGIALIIAALSGISFIAYKHPKSYEDLFPKLVVVVGSILAALFVWDMSRIIAHTDLGPFLDVDQRDKISAVMDSKAVLGWKAFVLFTGSFLYLMFLAVLPNLLRHDDKHKDESDDKDPEEVP